MAFVIMKIKDGLPVTRDVRFFDLGGGLFLSAHGLVDSTGAEMIGEKAKASSIPTNFATDQHLLGRGIVNVSDSFTRPADTTAYAIGDLVANSTVAGSVVPFTFSGAGRFAQGAGVVSRCRLFKTSTTLTNAQFTVHLFKTSPTVTVGDNAAFNVAGVFACNNGLNYIGKFPITMDTAFSDGANGAATPGANTDDMHFKLSAGTSLFALLEARAAYVPVSGEVFTAILEAEQT